MGGRSGSAFWDCKNDAGEEVAPAIYYAPEATDKKTGKIAIIKERFH